jgi:hypothetical protein
MNKLLEFILAFASLGRPAVGARVLTVAPEGRGVAACARLSLAP